MYFRLIATIVALIAVFTLAMPSMVLADNGRGATKSNTNVVVQPGSNTTHNTKSMSVAQTAKQVACTVVKAYDITNTVIGCTATAASVACLVTGPASGFANTVPCAPIYLYTAQKGGMDCVNGIGSAVIGKNWDRATFAYQPSLTAGINATGICDSPKSNNGRYSGGRSW